MNHEELRRSVVAELHRQGPSAGQSSDQLYNAIGGENKIGLDLDEFRSFLRHSNIPKIGEVEGENVSPRYRAPSVKRNLSHNKKRSTSQSSRNSTPDSTLKRFNPRTEGFFVLFNAARRLQGTSNGGNIAWNEIRNLYRKETNRHLNSEELNLICGTSNQTKHDLLTEKLRTIFEIVDSKGLIVRLNVLNTPSPSLIADENDGPGIASPPMSPLNFNDPEEHRKIMEKRRKITESLLRSGLLKNDGVRLSATSSGSVASNYAASQSSISSMEVIEKPEDVATPMDEVFDESHITEVTKSDSDSSTVSLFDEKIENLASGDMVLSKSTPGQSAEEEVFLTVSALEHRNSLGSIDDEPETLAVQNEETSAVQKDEEKNEAEVKNETTEDIDVSKAQISTVSSQMNAAFIANESQEISFGSGTGLETSGEQGYSTAKDCLSPMSDPDVSLNISTSLAEPDTPHITHEFAMCSSRNANDINFVMPQPDVSPLTEEDEDEEMQEVEEVEPVVEVRHRRNTMEIPMDTRPIEERVPHLSFTSRDSQSNDVPADPSKPEETVEDVVLPPIASASGGPAVVTKITTVTTTISPSRMTKPDWDTQDTDGEEDIPYDDDSQPDDHGHPPADFEVAGSSSNEAYTTHTVDLQGRGQSAKVEVSFVPPVKKEYFHVEEVPVRRGEDMMVDAKSLSTIPEDRETISSLSPQKELEQMPMDIDAPPSPSGEASGDDDASPSKKEKKVRIRVPNRRRRWFHCCCVL